MKRAGAAAFSLLALVACSGGSGAASSSSSSSSSNQSGSNASSGQSGSASASSDGNSSGDSTNPVPGNRACGLLSRSDLEESIGGRFDPSDNGGGPTKFPDGTSGRVTNCTFQGDGDRIDVTLYNGSVSGPGSLYDQTFTATNAQEPKPTPVQAGEKAFVNNEFGYVLENGSMVQIEYSTDLPSMTPEEARAFYVDSLTPMLEKAAFELQD